MMEQECTLHPLVSLDSLTRSMAESLLYKLDIADVSLASTISNLPGYPDTPQPSPIFPEICG